MKVYLAGPMTGLPKWNYPAFFEAEARVRAAGYEPTNPAHIHGESLAEALHDAVEDPQTWDHYMRHGIRSLTQCDAICLLAGWETSRGARLEVMVALALGMRVLEYRDI